MREIAPAQRPYIERVSQENALTEQQSEAFGLGLVLAKIALDFYRTNDPELRVKLGAEYRQCYDRMRSLEWDGGIDVSVELPEEFMPRDYLERVR